MKFKRYKLNDLSINGGSYGIGASAVEYDKKLYTYLRITDINEDGTLNYKDMMSVNDPKANQYILKKNDICFVRTGNSTGKTYFYDGSIENLVYAGFLIKFSIDEEKVNPKYVKYYMMTSKYKNWVKEIQTGSTRGNINAKMYGNLEILIPERAYQDKLVTVLDKITDKIKYNTQINDNLYKLSKTIFRDFYNSNSEKWNICKINDIGLYISDYVANGSFKSLAQNVKIYDNKNYALFIRNTDLKVNFTQGRKYVDEHSYNFLSKSKLYGKELIISNVGDVGSIFLCPSFEIPMTLGNNVIMIDSKETKVNYNYYLYYFFLSAEGQYLIDGITGGSAQPKFNKTDFKNSLIKLPSKEDILEFNDKIIPMYDIIEKNIKENNILEKLRDVLLPKLMNGEIDLDKVEI